MSSIGHNRGTLPPYGLLKLTRILLCHGELGTKVILPSQPGKSPHSEACEI